MAYKKFELVGEGDPIWFINPKNQQADYYTVKQISVGKNFITIRYFPHHKLDIINKEEYTKELIIKGKGLTSIFVPAVLNVFFTSKEELEEWIKK